MSKHNAPPRTDDKPRPTVLIPPDPLNPHERSLTLCIGGHETTLPLGKPVAVSSDEMALLRDIGRIDGPLREDR